LCVTLQSGACPPILAVAPDNRSCLANSRCKDRYGDNGPVVRRLGYRVNQHVPDQPFRTVWIASGGQQSYRPRDANPAVSDSAVLPIRTTSDLSRLPHRVLGGADDDGRALA